jgi:hypothetical protein
MYIPTKAQLLLVRMLNLKLTFLISVPTKANQVPDQRDEAPSSKPIMLKAPLG